MPEYKIPLPNRLQEIRHPAIVALKGVKIGPIFPIDDERELGMRHVDSNGTRNARWVAFRRARGHRRRIARASRRRNR